MRIDHVRSSAEVNQIDLQGGIMRKSLLGFVASLALGASIANAADVPVAPLYQPAVVASPWVVEAGARYWYSSGKNWYNLYDPVVLGQLNSRLTYDGMRANSGEGFFRIDSPWGIFVKGYAGGGSIFRGHLYDEDFPPAVAPYSQTVSDLKGPLAYADVDAGFTFYDGRFGPFVGPRVRFGAFAGWHYWHERADASGCAQIANAVGPCAGAAAIPTSVLVVTEDDKFNALRLGAVADLWLTPQWKLTLDAAYARVWQKALDIHFFTVGPDPASGQGNGLQLEGILNYQVTDYFNVGVGGRWWHYHTNATDQVFNSLLKYTTERYGVFVQGSVKFGEPLATVLVRR
jgi:hypothetical protein